MRLKDKLRAHFGGGDEWRFEMSFPPIRISGTGDSDFLFGCAGVSLSNYSRNMETYCCDLFRFSLNASCSASIFTASSAKLLLISSVRGFSAKSSSLAM